MPYYAGDPGIFSRFSFKKLFKFVGKVATPLASVASAVVPGVGGLISKGVELIGRARGNVQSSPILQIAAKGMQEGFMPPHLARVAGQRVAGTTPGGVAHLAHVRRHNPRALRVYRGARRRRY